MATDQATRFSLIFNFDGNWQEAAEKLPKFFDAIYEGSDRAGDKLGEFAPKAIAAGMALTKVEDLGKTVFSAGGMFFAGMGDFLKQGVESVMPLETMMQRIQATTHGTKDATREIINNAMVLAEKTPFVAQDVAALAQGLALAKVDLLAFKDAVSGADLTLELAQKRGFAKLDDKILDMAGTMKVTANSMLADLAVLSGIGPERMTQFTYGMQRALQTGQLRMLFDDIPIAFRQAIFETSGGAMKITAQKAIQNLFKFLSHEGQIGAAAAGSSTFGAIIGNFKDLPGKMFRTILGMPGTGGLFDRFEKVFGELFSTISRVFENARFLEAIKGAVTPVFEMMLKAAQATADFVAQVFLFVQEHPKLVAALFKVATAVSIFLMVAGAILTVVASVGALGLAFMAIAKYWALIRTAMSIAGAVFGEVALYIGLAVAAGYLLYQAFDSNFGHFRDICLGVLAVVEALGEGIFNMTRDTTTFSGETAQALQNMGLLDFVNRLLSIYNAAYNAVADFAGGFMSAYQMVGPGLSGMLAALEGLFDSIEGLVVAVVKLFLPTDKLGASMERGHGLAYRLGQGFALLASAAQIVTIGMELLVSTLVDMVTWAVRIAPVFQAAFAPFAMLWEAIVGVVDAFGQLLEGDFIGFFKTLGWTIVQVVLKPMEMLFAGVQRLMELLHMDKALSDNFKNFAHGGLRYAMDPTEGQAQEAQSTQSKRWSAPESYMVQGAYQVPMSIARPFDAQAQMAPDWVMANSTAAPQAAPQAPKDETVQVNTSIALDGKEIATAVSQHLRRRQAARAGGA